MSQFAKVAIVLTLAAIGVGAIAGRTVLSPSEHEVTSPASALVTPENRADSTPPRPSASTPPEPTPSTTPTRVPAATQGQGSDHTVPAQPEPSGGDATDHTNADEIEQADGHLGSVERAEGLARDCSVGNPMACDLLYLISDLDSADERLALDCGIRGPSPTGFCMPGFELDGDNLWFTENSPGVPIVSLGCSEGDATACDFLYFRSKSGTESERLGLTCGGRVEVAVPDCRTALGG